MNDTHPFIQSIEKALSTLISTPARQDRAWSDASNVLGKCSVSFRTRPKQPVAPCRPPVFASVSQHLHHWLQQRLGRADASPITQQPVYTLAADEPHPTNVAEERVLISEVGAVVFSVQGTVDKLVLFFYVCLIVCHIKNVPSCAD